MIERIISGGQTGADQAGWRAAKAAGIPTGGFMTHRFMTENGPRPEFREMYGAIATRSSDYKDRTSFNIQEADFTLVFIHSSSGPGTKLTLSTLKRLKKPHRIIMMSGPDFDTPISTADELKLKKVRILNIAGSRESKARGIGAWVEQYLTEVFRLMKEVSP